MLDQENNNEGLSRQGPLEGKVLAALSKINRAIADSSELKPALVLILENTVNLLNIDTAKIYLIDKKDGLFKGVACAGRREIDTPIEMEHYAEIPPVIGEMTIQIPLEVNGIKIGVFMADSSSSRRPITKEIKEVLEIFSFQSLAAIEKLRLCEDMKRVAVRDELTGAFVHNFFLSRAEEEAKRAAREKKSFSILIVDIDGFHRYNELYGRPSGDEMIVVLSKIINKSIRPFDVTGRPVNSISRNTGDELEALLTSCTRENALVVAHRISKSVKEIQLKFVDKPVEFSVCIGITTYPEDGTTANMVLKKAEEALGRAKKKGKDQVCTSMDTGNSNPRGIF